MGWMHCLLFLGWAAIVGSYGRGAPGNSSNILSEDGLRSKSWVREKSVLRVGAAGGAYIKSFQDWKDELGKENSSLKGWG